MAPGRVCDLPLGDSELHLLPQRRLLQRCFSFERGAVDGVAGEVVVVVRSGTRQLLSFSAVTAGVGAGLAFGKEVVALTESSMGEFGRLAEHHQVGELRVELGERAVLFEPGLGVLIRM